MIRFSTWLNNLQMELDVIPPEEFVEPEWELKPPDEVIVGDMTDDLKRLFTLLRSYFRETEMSKVNTQFSSTDDRASQQARANELMHKTDTLDRIFWTAIGENYNLWEHPQVFIRKGFKIAYSDVVPRPQIIGFNPFGGGMPG